MDPDDPLEQLRRSNPAPLDEMPDTDSPQLRALFDRVVDTAHQQTAARHHARRRRARLLPLLAVLLVGLLAAGYAAIQAVTQPLEIVCFSEPVLDATEVIGVEADERDPEAICAAAWQPGGEFGEQQAPPLVACVLDSGAIGVFPETHDDLCQQLGLTRHEPGPDVTNEAAIDLRDALTEQFLDAGCLTEQQGRAIVLEEFRRRGLNDWTVTTAPPFTASRPCATLAIDVPTRTVTLVPGLDPSGP